jgi:hypothetical protein
MNRQLGCLSDLASVMFSIDLHSLLGQLLHTFRMPCLYEVCRA